MPPQLFTEQLPLLAQLLCSSVSDLVGKLFSEYLAITELSVIDILVSYQFFFEIAIYHKMSIFSKGHDAKNFFGIKHCSTGKKASENPESEWVYRRWYTYCILNKCEKLLVK